MDGPSPARQADPEHAATIIHATFVEVAFGLIDDMPNRDGSPLHNWPSMMTEG
jgi:hypothetical protein